MGYNGRFIIIIIIGLFNRGRPLPTTTVTDKSSPLRPVHSIFFGNGEPLFIPLFVRHPWGLEVLFQFLAHDASPGGFYTTRWPLPRGPLDNLKVGVGETVLGHPKNVTKPPQASTFDGDVEVAGNCGVSRSSLPALLVESHQTFEL